MRLALRLTWYSHLVAPLEGVSGIPGSLHHLRGYPAGYPGYLAHRGLVLIAMVSKSHTTQSLEADILTFPIKLKCKDSQVSHRHRRSCIHSPLTSTPCKLKPWTKLATLFANVCLCAGVTPDRKIGKVWGLVENPHPPKDKIFLKPDWSRNSWKRSW